MIAGPQHDLSLAALVCGSIFCGSLLGMWVRARLPKHHLDKPTEDAVRIAMGTLATLTALVLGLLVAAARSSFDERAEEITQLSADLILLDRQFVHYGSDAADTRHLLHRYASHVAKLAWPDEFGHAADHDGWILFENVQDRIRALAPRGDAQRWLRERALEVSATIARTRWLIDVHRGSSIPLPFLGILVLWLSVLFASFGLFAPRNGTVMIAMLVSSVSIAASVYLVLEMDKPFTGTIRIPSAPVREALVRMGVPEVTR
ncbi:MAG: hypothetical protein IT293_05085 [Deltaproteobacteria bacterium]|nr:hypothetical protein [Deltaproteobacteria bacterium]